MTANQHATQATAVTLVTTAETVIGTLGPFSVNQGISFGGAGDLRLLQPATPPGAEGVIVELYANILVGTGATALTFRLRANSLTGAIIPTTLTETVVAGQTINASAVWLDATLAYPTGILYVVTAQMTAASGNSTVNVAVMTAEDANSFE